MTAQDLALALVSTIHHDVDDLATPADFATWVRAHSSVRDAGDADAQRRVIALRDAVRSLFARAVGPDGPDVSDAVRVLNEAAGGVARTAQLTWTRHGRPEVTHHESGTPADRLVAELARASIDFLAGPRRERLRACPAPRCVRYFVREHPRQQWCTPECGNRARVSRYYQRQRRNGLSPG
ncbi:CGNR zinc finger domain-containing protein [Umezawaea beigongshangensis]|uniref:CGNR zinc finger domain-containing protein n=1 Tax=Umezawaea beigongshangensis TaxID=2780383 RepID=UPI0027DB672A|nr:ABATE domain-containing protein [Umezawaea beigongshangensis]